MTCGLEVWRREEWEAKGGCVHIFCERHVTGTSTSNPGTPTSSLWDFHFEPWKCLIRHVHFGQSNWWLPSAVRADKCQEKRWGGQLKRRRITRFDTSITWSAHLAMALLKLLACLGCVGRRGTVALSVEKSVRRKRHVLRTLYSPHPYSTLLNRTAPQQFLWYFIVVLPSATHLSFLSYPTLPLSLPVRYLPKITLLKDACICSRSVSVVCAKWG